MAYDLGISLCIGKDTEPHVIFSYIYNGIGIGKDTITFANDATALRKVLFVQEQRDKPEAANGPLHEVARSQ